MILFGIVFFSIAISFSSSVTDNEYAHLPPVFELDNFDRCLLLGDEALYCYLEYHVQPTNPENASVTWNQIKELSANPKNYRHDYFRRGICVPFQCPNISRSAEDPELKKDLANCMNEKFEHLGMYGTVVKAECQTAETKKFDLLDYTVAIFLTIYILFVIFASFYEGFARYKSPKEYEEITSSQYGKILSCFSIPRNWDKFKTIDWTKDNLKFRAVQGVRFYNMILVIFTHACMMVCAIPMSNTKFSEEVTDMKLSILLSSGPYGVSTFFQFSALLMTYSIFKHFYGKNAKKLDLKTVALIIIYRYIRLTPCMAVIMVLHSTLLYHTGRGPWWDGSMGIDRRNCRKYGWSNLLYISNWVNTPEMCLSETWYLSVDMQAFILLIFLLYFSVKSSKRFWRTLITCWAINTVYCAWHLYRKSLFYFLRPHPENMYMVQSLYEDDGLWINTLNHTPMNLHPTFVGAALGFILYKYDKIEIDTTKTRYFLWWLLSFGLGLGIVIIPGIWIFSDNYYDSYWFSVPYHALAPTIYAIAVAIGSIGVTSGCGWAVNWVLEWPPMYYLGRISYTTYLAHYSIIFYLIASQKNLYSTSDFSIISESAKILTLSLIFGFILSMLVEYPISSLSSILLKQRVTAVDEKNKNEVKQKSS